MSKPNGRPSKYKPEYDEMLVEHMATGLSFESFAGLVQVCDDTIYEWAKVHPSFSDAKKRGYALNRLWWEKMGNAHITHTDSKFESTPKLNSTVYIFNMKNRFPKQWRDRTEVKSTVRIDSEAVRALSDEDLALALKEAVKGLESSGNDE